MIVFALAVRLAPRLGAGPEAPPADRRRAILAAIAASALAFALLLAAVPAPPVHPDTTRDFLMAADCLAGLPCDRGPPTSLGVIVQGALWTRFLALSGALGLGVAAVRGVVLALQANSAGVVVAAAWRRLPPAVAAWTAAAWVVLGAVVVGAPLLWNPSLAPLPLALFYVALLGVVERGSLAFAAAAGGLLALAMDCHVLFAALLPVLLAAAAGCGRRPLWAVAVAIGSLVAVLLVDSRAAWVVNARALVSTGAWMPVAALVAVAVAAGALARSRLGASPPAARAAVFLATAAVLAVGATVVLVPVAGAAGPARYLAPGLPAFALLVAAGPALAARGVARAFRVREAWVGLAFAACIVGIACFERSRGGDETGWSMTDAQAVAAPLYARLGSYPALRARLETRSRSLLTAMALFEPPTPRTTAETGEELILFRAPKDRPPPPGPWIATVDLGRSVALIGAVRPFLDRARLRACYAPLDDDHRGGCVATGLVVVPGGGRPSRSAPTPCSPRRGRRSPPPARCKASAGCTRASSCGSRPPRARRTGSRCWRTGGAGRSRR